MNTKAKTPRTPVKDSISDKEYLKKLAKRIAGQMKAKRAANRQKCAHKRVMASFSNPEKKYVVSEHSCTCPHFKFRCKHKGLACKHMKQLRDDLKVPEWTPDDLKWLESF